MRSDLIKQLSDASFEADVLKSSTPVLVHGRPSRPAPGYEHAVPSITARPLAPMTTVRFAP